MKDELKRILDKISDNTITAWSDNLEQSQDAVVIGNLDDVKYNGWLEDLINLKESL